MKKVVFTCITGGYDQVPEHKYINPEWDYILFTDNAELIRAGHIYHWTVRPLVFDKMDNVRNNRWHKINAHLLFPEYDYSLYLDGNITVNRQQAFQHIEKFIKSNKRIVIPIHPLRDCIYDEADAVKKYQIDYSRVVNRQMRILQRNKYPKHNGLFENNIMLRKHNDIAPALAAWWQMVRDYSKRDQLSGAYVMWKHNITITPLYDIPGQHKKGGDFTFTYSTSHNQDKVPTSERFLYVFRKTRKSNGRRNIYLFGIKVFSYKKES